jgi:hypothetical protein
MCDPVSKANEAAVCAAMVEGAQEALAGYCSSIDEDLALLRGVVGAAGAAGGGAAGEQLVRGSRQEVAVQVCTHVSRRAVCQGCRSLGGGHASALVHLNAHAHTHTPSAVLAAHHTRAA